MTNLIVARGASLDDLNHLYNGRFESDLIGVLQWQTSGGNGSLTRETVNPITGRGSLRQHIVSDTGGTGAYQSVQIASGQGHIGQTWRLAFKHRGEDVALMVYLDFNGASDIESDVYFTATESVQDYEYDFVIPAGASSVQVQIVTDWNGAAQDNKTYWLDDIFLTTVALA